MESWLNSYMLEKALCCHDQRPLRTWHNPGVLAIFSMTHLSASEEKRHLLATSSAKKFFFLKLFLCERSSSSSISWRAVRPSESPLDKSARKPSSSPFVGSLQQIPHACND